MRGLRNTDKKKKDTLIDEETKYTFIHKINNLKKEIFDLRNLFNTEYQKGLILPNNNKLIFLKKDKNIVSKIANLLLSLKATHTVVNNENGKKEILLEQIKEKLNELIRLINVEMTNVNLNKIGQQRIVLEDNLDNLNLALKYFKQLSINKELD